MNKTKQFSKGFKKGVKNFGSCISDIINTVLLGFVYIVGVGITSIIARLNKKRFLDTEKKEDSYWSDLNLEKKPTEEYYRQF